MEALQDGAGLIITSHCPSYSPEDLIISLVSLVLHLLPGNASCSKEKSSKQTFFCQASEKSLENQRGFPSPGGALAPYTQVMQQSSPGSGHTVLGNENHAARLTALQCCAASSAPEQVML